MATTSSRLRKELGLFDVYVLSTGAMISSGIFLLPGIAVALAGPAAVLAYLLAGIMILPAMLSTAELATAMPKAGGTYYFLDRTLGPLVGTVGGVGTWLALVLKSAFALIGMGAYIALVVDLPVVPTALVLTALFTILNVAGAKESSGLLRVLVGGLLVVLVFFILSGLFDVAARTDELRDTFTPFLEHGFDGVLATVGLQFISYIGLMKVASLAEEVRDPDRNIPLGMSLALAALFDALVPGRIARWLMVGAAIAAFTAMANAGITRPASLPGPRSRAARHHEGEGRTRRGPVR
jgi:amino acid transporter